MRTKIDIDFEIYVFIETPDKQLWVITKETNEDWVSLKYKFGSRECIPETEKLPCIKLYQDADKIYRVRSTEYVHQIPAKDMNSPIVMFEK